MEFSIHTQVLGIGLVTGVILGAVSSKTNFCTLGAVSDWVNMGDTARMRSWMLAMAIAILGVALLQMTNLANIGQDTFPPYQTATFAWLRYLIGGTMFGIGMTLASGCGNKTLVRIGSGNLKSLLVFVIAALAAYSMLWTDFYGQFFKPWVSATSIDLAKLGFNSQSLHELMGLPKQAIGLGLALAILAFVCAGREFRHSGDAIVGGLTMGLAVVVGWWVTGGSLGDQWKEYADFAEVRPLRVDTQSLTFVSPMGDFVHFLSSPSDFSLINFGMMVSLGVVLGSFIYSLFSGQIRWETFAHGSDFGLHVFGAVLMGVGGVLAMGCTVGQGVTGVSTLALGSILAVLAMVAGAAGTMKFLFWRMMREA
jgi:uncharacterized protein